MYDFQTRQCEEGPMTTKQRNTSPRPMSYTSRTRAALAVNLALLCMLGCADKKLSEPTAFCHRFSENPDNAAILSTTCFRTTDACEESSRQWDKMGKSLGCKPHRSSLWCFDNALFREKDRDVSCMVSEDDCLGHRKSLVDFYSKGFEEGDQRAHELAGECRKTDSYPEP